MYRYARPHAKYMRTQHTGPFSRLVTFAFSLFVLDIFFSSLSAFSFPLLLPAAALYYSEYVLRLKEYIGKKLVLGVKNLSLFTSQRGPCLRVRSIKWRGMVEVKAEFIDFSSLCFAFSLTLFFIRYYVCVFFCELFAPFFLFYFHAQTKFFLMLDFALILRFFDVVVFKEKL